MPANLTPQYLEAEQAFREAGTLEEKIRCLEEMLRVIPKHKGTDHLQGDIRRRLAKLRRQSSEEASRSHRGHSFKVHKEGAGQVALAGPPNVGKSALAAVLTNAEPQVAEYPFTTRVPVPAMVPYQDVKIQLIDLPPVSLEHEEHWVVDLLKAADAVVLVVDLAADPLGQLEFTLKHLEEKRLVPQSAAAEPGEDKPLHIVSRPMLVACNKLDAPGAQENFELLGQLLETGPPMLAVSAEKGLGLEDFRRALFELLSVIRVYSKTPGKKPDLQEPYVLPSGSTVLDFAETVHREMAEHLKFARIWSTDKYDGQKVNRNEVLSDGDILELHN
ncbi:MAG: 50S ribosome-binding GTPase [Candidatus Glassbacteria bacterium]|nr:50S ribosome-binding GTPase [Candidatus Glassbacteria bacterium]